MAECTTLKAEATERQVPGCVGELLAIVGIQRGRESARPVRTRGCELRAHGGKDMNRCIGRITMIVTIIGGAFVVTPTFQAGAATANLTVSGSVTCVQNYVEGVWVEVGSSSSKSGWATLSTPANTAHSLHYSRSMTSVPVPTNIRLHVGCGGTPSSWWSDNRTPSTSRFSGPISGSATLNARCNEGTTRPPVGVDNVRCSWGNGYPATNAKCVYTNSTSGYCTSTSGPHDWGYYNSTAHKWDVGWCESGFLCPSANPRKFAYRNCTDYAAWRSNFMYGTFTGNAKDWPTHHTSAWTTHAVSSTYSPSPGDLAVWTSGSSGHVAVVTTRLSNTSVIVEEFNHASKGEDGVRYGVTPNYFIHRN